MSFPPFLSRLVITLFLSLLIIGSANAQLKKGDYHLNFRSSIFLPFKGGQDPMLSLDITYLKMVNKSFMVGGEFSYFYRSLPNFNGPVFGNESFSNYRISQFTRYYFGTGRLAPFASLENLFQLTTIAGVSDSDFGYQLKPGIGINYFLRPNIALEGVLNTNLLNLGDFSEFENMFVFDIGLKLFFTNKFFTKGTALPDRILKKGNIISTTRLNFMRSFEGRKAGLITLRPNIRYFLTDRFNIFAGYSHQRSSFLTLFGAERTAFNQFSFALGASYYLPLTDQLFWNFDVSNNITMRGEEFSDVFDDGIRNMVTSINTSLHYFSGPAKFYGGLGYIGLSTKFGDELIKVSNSFQVFTGVDYYVSDYIFVNTDLRFVNIKFDGGQESNQTIQLSFGVGFIIGKSSGVEEEVKLDL